MSNSPVITVERCTDPVVIDRVLDELLPYINCDQYPKCPPATTLLANPNAIVIALMVDGQIGGLGMLLGNEVHTLFLPRLRGGKAIRAARTGMAWFWANTNYETITSFAFSHRPEVALFAHLMGFDETGTEDRGETIDGKPITRTNFIIRRK